MKLIVGLGNPGKEYLRTRHNIGFSLIDKYVDEKNIEVERKKFNGIYYEYALNGVKIILLKPQSFMNLSGEVVRKFVDYFNIDINDILVISDDLDLSVGSFKLKPFGSSGGHNGLRNIESNLSSNKFKRLRIGISKNYDYDIRDYVLSKISDSDMIIYNELFNILCNVIDDFICLDFDKVMNKYNKKNR